MEPLWLSAYPTTFTSLGKPGVRLISTLRIVYDGQKAVDVGLVVWAVTGHKAPSPFPLLFY